MQTNRTPEVALINNTKYSQKTMLRERTDTAFYNIQPGNKVGLFFQPRSLHVATKLKE